MNEETCPQCLNRTAGYATRLVQDTCGHTKCRMCLLLEMNGCRCCEQIATEQQQNHQFVETQNSDVGDTCDQISDELSYDTANTTEQSDLTCAHSPIHKPISPSILETHLARTIDLKHETTNVIRYHPLENTGNQVSVLKVPLGTVDLVKCAPLTGVNDATDMDVKSDESQIPSSPPSDAEKPPDIPSHITQLNHTPLLYQCKTCLKKFTNRLQAKRHLVCKTLNMTKETLECSDCGQTFARRSHLIWHIRRHTGERPYVCEICKKSFTQKAKLNRHTKLHTGETPFKCKQCTKQFRTKDALTAHSRTHTGEKPFACAKCAVRFADMSNLKKHQTIHTEEKPFMCSDCGATFSLKWRLTVHQRVHSRERPHTCSQCSRGFNNIKDLHRHEVIHSSTKKFTCDRCNTHFQRKDNLQRHIKNTHQEAVVKSSGSGLGRLNTAERMAETTDYSEENEKTELKKSPSVVENVVEKKNGSTERATLPAVATPQITVITSGSGLSENRNTPPTPKTNAVSVINGPVKLAFKTNAFKSNYNIKQKDFDADHNVDIYKRILSPMTSSGNNKDKQSERHQAPLHDADSIIKSLNSTHNESSEMIKHKMTPISVPRIHYETSFENGKHAIIKNIKFKLPPDYTSRLSKFNSQYNTPSIKPPAAAAAAAAAVTMTKSVETEVKASGGDAVPPENVLAALDDAELTNIVPIKPVKGIYIDEESEDCQTYAPLVTVSPRASAYYSNVYDKQNCVRTITKTSSVSDAEERDLSELHWRRRTSQILQPKLNGST